MRQKQSRVMLTKFSNWSEPQFNRQWNNDNVKYYNTQSEGKFKSLYCGPSVDVKVYVIEMQIDRKELMGIGEISIQRQPLMGRQTIKIYGPCQEMLRYNNYGYTIERHVSNGELRSYIEEFEWNANMQIDMKKAKLDGPLKFDKQMNDGNWLRMFEHRLLRGKNHLIRNGGIHHARFMEYYGEPAADDLFSQRIECIFRAIERRRGRPDTSH